MSPEARPAAALVDKIVLVTGATGALGRVVVKSLLGASAMVVAVFRSQEKFEELLDFVKGEVLAPEGVMADVSVPSSVQQMVEDVVRRHGRVDALLNLTGAYRGGVEVAATPDADWDFLMRTNLQSAFLCSRAVLPAMMKAGSGRIVCIGARQAVERKARAKSGAYAVSKAGVIALTEAIAEETKGSGITANCLLPGTIDTPANRTAMPKADFSKWVKPEEIASVIVCLISDGFSVASGASIPVYGKS